MQMNAQETEPRLVLVCASADVEDGEIFQATVEGIGKLALYRVGTALFASDDLCTHGKASLSEDGFIEGFTVTCSWHDGKFDIRSGEPCALPCTQALKTYAVIERGADLYIAL